MIIKTVKTVLMAFVIYGIYADSESMKFVSTIVGIIICGMIWFGGDD